MDNIEIQGSSDTYFTPTVNFNASTGKCSIYGESYLENSFEFYDRLSSWFKQFFQESDNLQLDFKLTYFNTSSSRAIADMLRTLKEYQDSGKTVVVNWHYPEPDDDELRMEAEDFIDETGVNMNLVEYELED